MAKYTVGRTLRTSDEFPEGVPCILYDGDSVLCEFHSLMYGEEQAAAVCKILNNVREDAVTLVQFC